MKTLKFKSFKINLILSGAKTSTIRLFDDKDLKKDDEIIIVNGETGKEVATARIEKVTEKPLKEITNSDLTGHEKYDSFEEMLNSFKNHYKNNFVDGETPAKIVQFKLNKVND